MPSPLNVRVNTKRFFSWLRRTLDILCERPEHLQRLSIIGSGFVMWPTMIGFALIVWLGYGPDQADQSLNFMGMALVGSMLLWGLVIVALLGIVKGLRLAGPGGMSVSIQTTADDPDVDPTTSRPTVSFEDGQGGGGSFGGGEYGGAGAGFGGRDRRNGRPMPQVNITQVAGDLIPDVLKPGEGEVSD